MMVRSPDIQPAVRYDAAAVSAAAADRSDASLGALTFRALSDGARLTAASADAVCPLSGWRAVVLPGVGSEQTACWNPARRVLAVEPSAGSGPLNHDAEVLVDVPRYCDGNPPRRTACITNLQQVILGVAGETDGIDTGRLTAESEGTIRDRDGDGRIVVYFPENGDPKAIRFRPGTDPTPPAAAPSAPPLLKIPRFASPEPAGFWGSAAQVARTLEGYAALIAGTAAGIALLTAFTRLGSSKRR